MEAAVKEEISRLEGIIRRANMAYWGVRLFGVSAWKAGGK